MVSGWCASSTVCGRRTGGHSLAWDVVSAMATELQWEMPAFF